MKKRRTPPPEEAELLDWLFWCGLMALIITLAVIGHAAVSRGMQ